MLHKLKHPNIPNGLVNLLSIWISVPKETKVPNYMQEVENDTFLRAENSVPENSKILYLGDYPIKEHETILKKAEEDLIKENC